MFNSDKLMYFFAAIGGTIFISFVFLILMGLATLGFYALKMWFLSF
jgi:hypothetical protein